MRLEPRQRQDAGDQGDQRHRRGGLQRAGEQAGVAIEGAAERRDQQRRQHQHRRNPERARPASWQTPRPAAAEMRGLQARLTRCDRPMAITTRPAPISDGMNCPACVTTSAKSGSIQEKSGAGAEHAERQQQRAAQRDHAGAGGDGEVRLAPAADRLHACGLAVAAPSGAAAQQDLVAGEQRARQEQRNDVVVQAEHHDRADDVRRRQDRASSPNSMAVSNTPMPPGRLAASPAV